MTDWKTEEAGAAARDRLLEKLDAAITEVDAGRWDRARAIIFLRRWITDSDTEGVPAEVLEEAGKQTDTAHFALSRWPPDLVTATKSLRAARRVLA